MEQARATTTALPGPGRFVPPTPAELSAILPDLEFLALIGQGGMGAVYRARQKRLDRIVAVKVLPQELGQDPAFAARFEREALALARLNHPHLVTIHDVGRAGGWCYLVMEFVDGASLRQVMRTGRLAPAEALALVPQLCDALQYAHDAGVVHRDIKPENILLDQRGRVKIADFGLAKLADPAGKDSTDAARAAALTATGSVLGTVHYMAPEQVEGARTVDHRADIFSLGVVIYEMLTGSLPLGRFEPPSRRVQIDVRLDEVVLRALEKDPDKRYQKASQVQQAVDAAGRPESSATVPLPPSADRKTSKKSQEFDGIRIDADGIRLGNATSGIHIGGEGIKVGDLVRPGTDADGKPRAHDQTRRAVLLTLAAVATAVIAARHTDHWLGALSLTAAPAMLWGAWCLHHRLSAFWAMAGAYATAIPAIGAWGVSFWLGLVAAPFAFYLLSIPGSAWFGQPPASSRWHVLFGIGCIFFAAWTWSAGPLSLIHTSTDEETVAGTASGTGLPALTPNEVAKLRIRLLAIEADSRFVDVVLNLINAPWIEESSLDGVPALWVEPPELSTRSGRVYPTGLRDRIQSLLLATGRVTVFQQKRRNTLRLQLTLAGAENQYSITHWRLLDSNDRLLWMTVPSNLPDNPSNRSPAPAVER